MAEGWIKLNRKIQQSDIWNSKDPFDSRSAWVDLLLMASFTDDLSGSPEPLERGQVFCSIRGLANRWHWSEKRVREYLGTLRGTQMVTLEGTQKGTLLTLVNYGKYQGRGHTQGHTEGHTQGHTEGHTYIDNLNNKSINKNNKNIKNNSKSAPERRKYGLYGNVLLSDEELEKLRNEFPDDYNERILNLSEYMASTGKKYKSHLATIRNWDRMQKKRDAATPHRMTPEEEQKRAWEAFLERHKDEPDGVSL